MASSEDGGGSSCEVTHGQVIGRSVLMRLIYELDSFDLLMAFPSPSTNKQASIFVPNSRNLVGRIRVFFYRVFNRSFFCVVPKRNLNRKNFVSIALLLWPRVPKNERELMIFQHCDWFYWLMIHMFCLYQTIMSSRRVFLYLVLLDFNRLLYKKLNNRQ